MTNVVDFGYAQLLREFDEMVATMADIKAKLRRAYEEIPA